MQIETIPVRQAFDNAFLQESITEADFELFRRRLLKLLNQADVYHWYVFDVQDFERYFYESKKLTGWYEQWKQGQKVSSRTQFVYDQLSGFVYELYGLSEEEVKIVDESVG